MKMFDDDDDDDADDDDEEERMMKIIMMIWKPASFGWWFYRVIGCFTEHDVLKMKYWRGRPYTCRKPMAQRDQGMRMLINDEEDEEDDEDENEHEDEDDDDDVDDVDVVGGLWRPDDDDGEEDDEDDLQDALRDQGMWMMMMMLMLRMWCWGWWGWWGGWGWGWGWWWGWGWGWGGWGWRWKWRWRWWPSTSRKSTLRGGSRGTRGDRTWACQGGSKWKVWGFPMVLLPAYSLLKQEQLQLAQLAFVTWHCPSSVVSIASHGTILENVLHWPTSWQHSYTLLHEPTEEHLNRSAPSAQRGNSAEFVPANSEQAK